MRGVINVRGSVVPVVDLRLKFGMSGTERTKDTRIVVMEIALDGDLTTIGTLQADIHPMPPDKSMSGGTHVNFIYNLIFSINHIMFRLYRKLITLCEKIHVSTKPIYRKNQPIYWQTRH
jgi:hypothetical protein